MGGRHLAVFAEKKSYKSMKWGYTFGLYCDHNIFVIQFDCCYVDLVWLKLWVVLRSSLGP